MLLLLLLLVFVALTSIILIGISILVNIVFTIACYSITHI